MSTIKDQCKHDCRDIVMSAGLCEKCEEESCSEQHHGLYKSSQRIKLNGTLLYDPDLQFALCSECHRSDEDAPHVNNDAFLDAMEEKGGHRACKAQKIREINQGPLVMVSERDIDYRAIRESLTGYRRRSAG